MNEPVVPILPDELEETVSETTVPDRADAPVSVITERFLKAVVEHVPLDRIEELHLFSPLRQGGVETGIAVIAARVPLSAVLDVGEELPFEGAETPVEAAEMPLMPVRERHTVYTARYRLVQKGPERGKWEADVVAEAEAPLITVETVVRGVQRRAGEESEIVRFTAKQIAYALHLKWPVSLVSAGEPPVEPPGEPSVELSGEPSVELSGEPSVELSGEPSVEMSDEPSVELYGEPSDEPSGETAVEAIEELVDVAIGDSVIDTDRV